MAEKLSFWDLLDDVLLTDERPPTDKDVAMYPSEAAVSIQIDENNKIFLGNCNRKSWLRNKIQRAQREKEHAIDFEVEVEQHTPTELWKFKISSGVEDIIIDVARSKDYVSSLTKESFEYFPELNDEEKEKYGTPLIRGELDLVIKLPDSEDIPINRCGIEIKSFAGYYATKHVIGTKSYKGNYLTVPQPKDDNLLQTILYLFYFSVIKKEIPYFKVVYLSRENGKRSEFDVTLCEEEVDGKIRHRVYVNEEPYKYKLYAEDIIDNYIDLHKAIIDNKIPERSFSLQYTNEFLKYLYDNKLMSKTDAGLYEKAVEKASKSKTKSNKPLIKKGDWQCSYCNYKNFCYDEDSNPVLFNEDTPIILPENMINTEVEDLDSFI